MLSLEIIVGMGALLALLTGAMVRAQVQRGRLPMVRSEGRCARA